MEAWMVGARAPSSPRRRDAVLQLRRLAWCACCAVPCCVPCMLCHAGADLEAGIHLVHRNHIHMLHCLHCFGWRQSLRNQLGRACRQQRGAATKRSPRQHSKKVGCCPALPCCGDPRCRAAATLSDTPPHTLHLRPPIVPHQHNTCEASWLCCDVPHTHRPAHAPPAGSSPSSPAQPRYPSAAP